MGVSEPILAAMELRHLRSAIVLAEFITNAVVFSAQDHLGNLLTNNQKNHVIHLNLEFYQAKRALQIAQYYKLETSVTRRAE